MIARMTDEQLDERVRAYLSYRAEEVASRAASSQDVTAELARRLGLADGTRSARARAARAPNLRLARVAFALLLLILGLVAAVYVGSLFRERYAPDGPRVDVTLQGQPWAITGAYGSIWVGTLGNASVYQLDPRDGTIRSETSVAEPVCGNIERGYSALWFAQCSTHALTRIDPQSLQVDRLVGYGTDQIGVGDESIWASDGSNVVRLDPVSLATQAEIPVGGESLVTFGEGSAWAIMSEDATVMRIDPDTNEVIATIPLRSESDQQTYPVHAVAAAGALWVADEIGLKLYRVDAETNAASIVDVPLLHEASDSMDLGDWYVTYGRGLIWVRTSADSIVGIDPATERVVEQQATTPGGGGAFFVADDSVWTGNNAAESVSGIRLP